MILLAASVLALPPAWWLLEDWSSQFPLRPGFSVMLFLLPVALLLTTGLVSILWNILRTMRVPVSDVLRYE